MEIIIKNKINRPTSIYRLILKYMHGDGDAYTSGEFDFTDMDELTQAIVVLTDLYDSHNSEKYAQILEKKGLKWDDWCDYFEEDATCQGYTAPITNVSVNYFDENGNEYTTEIKK